MRPRRQFSCSPAVTPRDISKSSESRRNASLIQVKPVDIMQSLRNFWPPAVVLLLCTAAPAHSRVLSEAQIVYFDVDGVTPAQIYRDILERGPRIGGKEALASIGTRAMQDAGLAESGGSCRLTDYTIKLQFVIRRPRIAHEDVLPAADLALWRQMNEFIGIHENQHKEVWLGCAAEHDSRMSLLSAPTCDELLATAQTMWKQMLANCDRKQRSYDAEQSRELMQQPFMQRARQGAGER